MKKFFSILFTLLILISGLHLSLATHFCGGNIAAKKVSVTGKLASCGMETSEDMCPIHGVHFNSLCCDDEVIGYSTDNIYTPTNSEVINSSQHILQVFNIPVSFSFHSFSDSTSLFTSVGPPDNLLTSAVSLAGICVFRI